MTIYVINLIILLFFPFLFIGIINKTKAIWAGRAGASCLQPYYDFLRLLAKGEVISTNTSFIFRLTPVVTYASILLAGLLLPIIKHASILDFRMNFVLFAYILALGKFFSVLGAMDTGSSFEGLGASREMTFSAIAEPAFFITIASLSAITGSYTFSQVFLFLQKSGTIMYLIMSLSALTLFILMIIEGSRVPVDDPNTHLELTMIHEVMILDNSGPDLAIISHGAAMKVMMFGILIANLFIPPYIGIFPSLGLLMAILFLLAIIIGTIESFIARLRLSHVPQFIFFAISLSMITICSVLLFIYGGGK